MKIGFIGSGIMGRPMAENLLRAGHQLYVYGRRFDRIEPMLVMGALGKGTPAEVAAESDITFTWSPTRPTSNRSSSATAASFTAPAPAIPSST